MVNSKVNKISSTKTALPYEYYSLPFCRPDPIINSAENLGAVLRGDRILNSLYQVCDCPPRSVPTRSQACPCCAHNDSSARAHHRCSMRPMPQYSTVVNPR
jgi:hypothetical protein